jgi:type II secretory pathway pseudopilin PulG
MTLLELTVVILVLLSLVAILFVGARAWKKGSDRAANVLNLRNIQQAVRGHENVHGLIQNISPLSPDDIFIREGNLGYLVEPHPPSSTGVANYTYLGVVPSYGTLYVTNVNEIGAEYAPPSYADW